jgi:GDP-4-dehydro-6-deoxy-D-mannose reductase
LGGTTGRALITGVSGFAGGYLAQELLRSGWAVAGTSPHGAWEASSPEDLKDQIPLLAWDFSGNVAGRTDLYQFLCAWRPTAIFHLAALSVPERCGTAEPTPEAWQINVEGTRLVLEVARGLDPVPRVLVVSSSHVYGHVEPENPFVDETSPTRPVTGYGKTKLAAERLAQEFHERGVPTLIVRAFHHSGPRQLPPMLLPQWAMQFADPAITEVTVYTLWAYLDLCDVRDVVRAYRLLMEGGQTGIFNVGSGRMISTGRLFELFVRISGRQLPAREIRPGLRYEPIAKIDRAQAATGWRPEIPLEQTVADILAWARACRGQCEIPSPQGPEGR